MCPVGSCASNRVEGAFSSGLCSTANVAAGFGRPKLLGGRGEKPYLLLPTAAGPPCEKPILTLSQKGKTQQVCCAGGGGERWGLAGARVLRDRMLFGSLGRHAVKFVSVCGDRSSSRLTWKWHPIWSCDSECQEIRKGKRKKNARKRCRAGRPRSLVRGLHRRGTCRRSGERARCPRRRTLASLQRGRFSGSRETYV